MRPTTHEYDTELLYNGEVVTLGGMVYRGRTVLSPGPDMFLPLERWAQSVADQLSGPVSWRAISEGEVVREGTMHPAP
ncbi:hypothetical protein CDO52_10015 [Nocardiopsis gilva YIM 90087]|uniref:Uncharacterized protein n=1 Tax=Nocardiopsis gilva YIM 90087 TaxID=1235441 RepID=A0A223S4P5_9ACTN|nr:hypothetical protein [Nocardiopsis gilva]ASU83071.1 hypothetical protein CDO52_10015 [Nocardiopsis gilva YIM 90087]